MAKEFGIGTVVTVKSITGVVVGESEDWLVIESGNEQVGAKRLTVNKHSAVVIPGQHVILPNALDAELSASAEAQVVAALSEPEDTAAPGTFLDELPNFDDDEATSDLQPAEPVAKK